MRPRRLVAAAICVAVLAPAATARADHPTIPSPYRFISSASTLSRSDVPGHKLDLSIHGWFDLAIDQHNGAVATAQFVDVFAQAGHPLLDITVDVDEALNLTGLTGVQLPVGAPFDVYHFTGKKPAPDNSEVSIFARVLGPWLSLDGGTTPPPQSTNVPAYTLQAVARTLPFADFFEDDVVDGRDLQQWGSHFGQPLITDPTSQPYGDADGDLDADGADFLIWQRQIGPVISPVNSEFAAAVPSIARHSSTVPDIATVPEPTAALMLVVGAVRAMICQRKHPWPRDERAG
jgi:hypothetical protein